ACTGGTLICKCIAAMPNVQLLSEIDPLSRHSLGGAPRFAPTDLLLLLRQSTQGADDAQILEIFRSGLQIVHRHAGSSGHRLVLRDHAHSQFCMGPLTERPTLREIVLDVLPVRSIVTVRHPL